MEIQTKVCAACHQRVPAYLQVCPTIGCPSKRPTKAESEVIGSSVGHQLHFAFHALKGESGD